jgi:hypothetical protein
MSSVLIYEALEVPAGSLIVSNLMLLGIQPEAKWRALRKLERAGLIEIERHGRHNTQSDAAPAALTCYRVR